MTPALSRDTRASLSGLYIITAEHLTRHNNLHDYVSRALDGGARLVQFRDKSDDHQQRLQQACQLVALCERYAVPLIINDDVELTVASGAHGVHLGRQDCQPDQARQILGDNAIIGVSCYNEWQRALDAAHAGADYIAFGSFFESRTKPDAVKAELDLIVRAKQQLTLPVAAIGGITPDNGTDLIRAGADMLAVIEGIFAGPDITAHAHLYTALFHQVKTGK